MSDKDKDTPGSGTEPEKNVVEPEPAKEPDTADEVSKWKTLARKHEAQAKANAKAAARLQEIEDEKKSEIDKATDRVTAAEKAKADAERKLLQIEVALDKAPEGMSVAQVRKLSKRLAGDSREEFEADADELFADFKPDTGEEEEDGDKPGRGTPKENLKPGAAPKAKPEEDDPVKLAEQVPRGW